ncbi:MAG: ketopantoate reductase family protein [Microbacter sp.]
MRIGIIGTGGVGGYFGAKLAKAGNEVIFIARGKHLQAMLENGLQIKSIKGDFAIHPVNATDQLEALRGSTFIIMATKAWQVKEVAQQLKNIIDPDTFILPLENGILSSEELLEIMPHHHVLGGLCRIISKIKAPGIIEHVGVNPTITFGELDNTSTKATETLKQLFDQAGIESYHAKDIQAERWKKFTSICVSGLLALTRSNYGAMRSIPETRSIMIQLYHEIVDVAKAAQINLPDDFVQKIVAITDALPAESNASMARDIWEGKPSELEYQNGTIVRLGKKLNVPTPINDFIYGCLLPMELKVRNSL